jgi:hypothetical protein
LSFQADERAEFLGQYVRVRLPPALPGGLYGESLYRFKTRRVVPDLGFYDFG